MSEPFKVLYTGTRPEYGTQFSAGYDLVAASPRIFSFGAIHVVPIDLFTAFPPDKFCLFVEKGGMALKGFDVKGGLIDADYRKVWGVMLRYLPAFRLRENGTIELTGVSNPLTGERIVSRSEFSVTVGQKLCNLVIVKNAGKNATWENGTLPDSDREGGFGSTGTHG